MADSWGALVRQEAPPSCHGFLKCRCWRDLFWGLSDLWSFFADLFLGLLCLVLSLFTCLVPLVTFLFTSLVFLFRNEEKTLQFSAEVEIGCAQLAEPHFQSTSAICAGRAWQCALVDSHESSVSFVIFGLEGLNRRWRWQLESLKNDSPTPVWKKDKPKSQRLRFGSKKRARGTTLCFLHWSLLTNGFWEVLGIFWDPQRELRFEALFRCEEKPSKNCSHSPRKITSRWMWSTRFTTATFLMSFLVFPQGVLNKFLALH